MRRSVPGLLVLLVACLLAGCGLPVERGVRVPEAVVREGSGTAQEGGTSFLAPGWRPGLQPAGLVRAFLQAQGSPDDDHAIAREFLAPDAREVWDDDAEVLVYESTLETQVVGDETSDEVQVRLRGNVTSSISAAGTLDRTAGVIDELYTLRRDAERNWRLAAVPDGLRLRPVDVDRSYTTQLVYYLAKGTGEQGHLVPDPALLLLDDEPAGTLVERLVSGPSQSLSGAVVTAIEPGTQVRSVTTDAGVVTVDLGPQILQTTPDEREDLSAQLVWTLRAGLPAFAQLRLLADGSPLEVPGVDGDVQDRDAWDRYDPDGLPDQVATYYVSDGRLRTLDSRGAPLPAAANTLVDRAAVDPRTDDLAVLTEIGEGLSEVRVGPLAGPLPAQPLYTGGGLRSPSWGSGRRGLWMLQTGAVGQVLLLDRSGAVQQVPVQEAPPGQIAALRVSRDGARIALVIGEDDPSRRVYVAQVAEGEGGGLRIGRPRLVGPGRDLQHRRHRRHRRRVGVGHLARRARPLRRARDATAAARHRRLRRRRPRPAARARAVRPGGPRRRSRPPPRRGGRRGGPPAGAAAALGRRRLRPGAEPGDRALLPG
jgi:hypothetical protein